MQKGPHQLHGEIDRCMQEGGQQLPAPGRVGERSPVAAGTKYYVFGATYAALDKKHIAACDATGVLLVPWTVWARMDAGASYSVHAEPGCSSPCMWLQLPHAPHGTP